MKHITHLRKLFTRQAFYIYALPAMICLWGMMFWTPLAYITTNTIDITWKLLLANMVMPLFLFLSFFCNYLYLVKHFYFNGQRTKFWLANFTISLIVAFFIQLFNELIYGEYISWGHTSFFFIRDTINLLVAGTIALAMQLAHQYDITKHEALLLTKEAELENMKKEISPHFLLNTLNNIYALTTFDTQKAQETILGLSKMLRTLLYTDTTKPVPLQQSIEFMETYVKLTQLRLADNVIVNTHIDTQGYNDLMIEQMLIVPLVENAFKHGVNPTKKSFIDISVTANEKSIVIEVKNSNYPKDSKDKSGHGVGLQQLEKRLDLIYHNNYKWEKGESKDKKTYTSKITLYDTKLRNH